MIKHKKGFTLLETLISLALIGVLAATVLPGFIRKLPSENKVMFRKSYRTLERAIGILVNDNLIYPAEMTDTSQNQRGFNYTDDPTGASTGYNKFCYHLASTLKAVNISCPAFDDTEVVTKFATTSDNVEWYIYTVPAEFPVSSTDYTTKIIFDVNGESNGSDCFSDTGFVTYMPVGYAASTCTNPDTFIVGVRYDGKIQVGSGASTDTEAVEYLTNITNIQD